MTLQLTINGVDFTSNWRVYESRWSMKSWYGESVQSEFVIDDIAGTIDHDNLAARKIVEVWEDASGTPVCMYRGRVANKSLGMGAAQWNPAMRWTVFTEDYNVDLRGIMVHDAERPEETDDERFEAMRIAFLNGAASTHADARASTELGNTYIGSTPADAQVMDAEHYENTDPVGVFNAIAELTGRNFWVYLNDDGTGELVYMSRSDMTLLADIELTDDDATADGVDVFAAYKGPNAGDHAGQDVLSGGAIVYEDGSRYEDHNIGGAAATYDKWELTFQNDLVTTDVNAQRFLNKTITGNDEANTYFATIDMRPEDAHRIRAGMMVPLTRVRANKNNDAEARAVTVTHEPVKPNADGESWYRVTMELGRPHLVGRQPKIRRQIPRPPTVVTGTARFLGAACSSSGANLDSDYPPWMPTTEERVVVQVSHAVPVGHTLIAVTGVQQADWGAAPDTVYDEDGNTWTKDAEHEFTGSSSDDTVQIWRAPVTNALEAGDYVRWALDVGGLDPSSQAGGRCIGVYSFPGALTSPDVGTGDGDFGNPVQINTPAGDIVIAGLVSGSNGPMTVTPDTDWSPLIPLTKVQGSGDLNSAVYAQLREDTGTSTWMVPMSAVLDWAAIAVGYDFAGSGGGGGGTGGPVGTIGGTGSSSSGPAGTYIPVGSVLEHSFIEDGGPYHEADQILTDDGDTVQEELDTIEGELDDLENAVGALESLGPVLSYSEAVGDASATSFDVVHGLGTTDVLVQSYDLSGALPEALMTSWVVLDEDTVTVDTDPTVFDTATLRVVVHGAPGASGGGGGGGGGGSFSPADIDDLGLWLDADDASTFSFGTGTAVATWADKSGAGRNMTQATSANQPARVATAVNGRAVVRFDGTNDRLELDTGNLDLLRNLGGASLFIVNQVDNTTADKTLFWASVNGSNNSRAQLRKEAAATYAIGGRRLDADAFDGMTTPPTYAAGTVVIDHVDFDWADSAIYHYLDGTLDDSDTGWGTSGVTSDTNSQFIAIGRGSSGGVPALFLDGDVCEAIVVQRVVTADERDSITEYLADKWLGGNDINVQSVWVGGIEEE